MIFWMGLEKRTSFLTQVLYVANVGYKPIKKYRTERGVMESIKGKARIYAGFHFLENVAVVRNNEEGEEWVNIFYVLYKKPGREHIFKERLKIYTEKDKISEMPEHVLVRTSNLDFIRELFDLGKKVSWFEPEIEFAAEFCKFDFTHLFIDLFDGKEKVVFPTGKVFDNKDIYGNMFIDHRNPTRPTKYRKLIGYWPEVLRFRVHKRDYVRRTLYKKHRNGYEGNAIDRWCLYPEAFRIYYNMLSITYMLCKKSIAASAPNKTAPHE